jgi:hypothetical protein
MQEDPYLLEYGECLLPRVSLESPRSRRQRQHQDTGELADRAEFMMESFLNGLAPKLSPSDVASIAGSGSFFVEESSPRAWMTADNSFSKFAPSNKINSSFTLPSKETKIQDEEMKDERLMLHADRDIDYTEPDAPQEADNDDPAVLVADQRRESTVSRLRQAYRLFRIESNRSQHKAHNSKI